MDTKEITFILKKYAGMDVRESNGNIVGFGSIAKAYHLFYIEAKRKLENLPWQTKIVYPYSPKDNEYPQEDGEYITMLDCNEHEVMVNRFSDGHFTLYDRTHIKWWMKLPDDIQAN